MNDCRNAVIRDQLPDLLHDRLAPSARATVMAHVDGCVDCRAELDLLRDVRGMLVAQSPRIDIRSIVAALPKPPVIASPVIADPKVVDTRRVARRRVWSDWRVAAAVVLFVAGGSSLVLLRQAPVSTTEPSVPSEIVVPTTSPNVAVAEPTPPSPSTAAVTKAPSQPAAAETVASAIAAKAGGEIGVSGHLADLDDEQLKALLDDIDHIQAVPITDPEPVAIRIDSRNPTTARGRGT